MNPLTPPLLCATFSQRSLFVHFLGSLGGQWFSPAKSKGLRGLLVQLPGTESYCSFVSKVFKFFRGELTYVKKLLGPGWSGESYWVILILCWESH